MNKYFTLLNGQSVLKEVGYNKLYFKHGNK